MNYTIKKEEIVYQDYLKIKKAEIEHDSFEAGKTINLSREILAHGDAVAILIYEKDTDCFLLTKQFRYGPSTNNEAWMTEVVAGMVDEGEDPVETARRETMEELGYTIKDIEHISTCYSSPGSTTERVYTYFAEVSSKDKIEQGGGLDSEHEDIKLIRIPRKDIHDFITKINDYKTLVSFQWFLLNKQS